MSASVDCIVALDLSLACTGWLVAQRNGPSVYGTIFPISTTHPGARLDSLRDGLTALFLEHPGIQEVWFEKPLPPGSRGQFAVVTSWACDTIAKMVAFQRDVPIIDVHMGTARKHVLGRGSFGDRDSNKAAALAWCKSVGLPILNDNAADAAVVGEWGANCNSFSIVNEPALA